MTAPTFTTAATPNPNPSRPATDLPSMDEAVEAPFGPDETKTTQNVPPLSEDKPKRRPTPVEDVIKGIGTNKATAGRNRKGLRKLTEEDRDNLAAIQAGVGMFVGRFGKQDTGVALVESAEKAADAWLEVAEENRHVHRAVQWMTEGGAWGKLMMAYAPVMATLVPEQPPKWLRNLMPNLVSEEDEQA